jgi:hypothetical protein
VPPPKGEVGAVAAILLCGVTAIAGQWSPLFKQHGYSAAFAGVFCHAAPQVEFTDSQGNTRPCELGDILFVIDEFDPFGAGLIDRRACLVQAKLASGTIAIASGGPWRQLDLI